MTTTAGGIETRQVPHRVRMVAYEAPLCIECGKTSRLEDAPAHAAGIGSGKVYRCGCGAYALSAPDGRPSGRPGSRATRRARREFHEILERAAARVGGERRAATRRIYARIAGELAIDRYNCHAGLFDEATCVEASIVAARIALGEVAVDPGPADAGDAPRRVGNPTRAEMAARTTRERAGWEAARAAAIVERQAAAFLEAFEGVVANGGARCGRFATAASDSADYHARRVARESFEGDPDPGHVGWTGI